MKRKLFVITVVMMAAAMIFSCEEDKTSGFSIEVTVTGEGLASADKASSSAGEKVTLTAAPSEGYALAAWTAVSGEVSFSDPYAATTTFIMPAENVVINAEFVEAQSHKITVNVTGSGSASADKESAIPGETVTVTASPNGTSEFLGWTVTSGNVTLEDMSATSVQFVMPNADVVLAAEFTEDAYDIFELIEDSNFAAYVKWRMTSAQTVGETTYPAWDIDMDGTLSPEEVEAVEAISINGGYNDLVVSLAGIEKFTGLLYLDAANNALTEVDLSSNTVLTNLNLGNNPDLKELDLSANKKLTTLDCQYCALSVLDLSANEELVQLQCNDNYELSYMELGNKPRLTVVDCSYCYFTNVDLSQAPMLNDLTISNNYLTSLDLSANTLLTGLDCWMNPDLEVLDLSNNKELRYISASNLGITELNLSGLNKLQTLACGSSPLTKLDVSNLPALNQLWVQTAELTELNVENTPSLCMILCYGNHLTELDATGLTYGAGMMGQSGVWTVYGGQQTDADGNDINLTLKIRPDMKEYWDVELAGLNFNEGVVVEIVD